MSTMYPMSRPDAQSKQAAHWLHAAAQAENGRALQAIGCAYADLLAAQCEANMHRAVRRQKEVNGNGHS